jgi:hypothetical protein
MEMDFMSPQSVGRDEAMSSKAWRQGMMFAEQRHQR